MDIRKLQRAIVDGLEDVKAQNIAVFNTEHLSSLFERVIIASGTSNRQTKSLASSVRESVKGAGFPVPRTEGEDNGEWIIVDCGAAVVHVMQPTIREFYHLEEIWGDKPVKMRMGAAPTGLVKASAPAGEAPRALARRGRGQAPAAAKTAPARKATVATKKAPARRKVAMPGDAEVAPSARKPPKPRVVTRVVGVKKAPAKKVAAKKAPARRPAAKKGASRA